eukprot:IDg18454t1
MERPTSFSAPEKRARSSRRPCSISVPRLDAASTVRTKYKGSELLVFLTPYSGIWQHTKKMNSVTTVHITFSLNAIRLFGCSISGSSGINGRTTERHIVNRDQAAPQPRTCTQLIIEDNYAPVVDLSFSDDGKGFLIPMGESGKGVFLKMSLACLRGSELIDLMSCPHPAETYNIDRCTMNPEERHEDLLSSSTTALRSLTISSETADRSVRDATASLAELLTKVTASRESRSSLALSERSYQARNAKALGELQRVDQEIVAAK